MPFFSGLSELWATVIVIAVLLIVSAFFSMAETAMTAASRPRLHALARQGSRRARIVNEIRDPKNITNVHVNRTSHLFVECEVVPQTLIVSVEQAADQFSLCVHHRAARKTSGSDN